MALIGRKRPQRPSRRATCARAEAAVEASAAAAAASGLGRAAAPLLEAAAAATEAAADAQGRSVSGRGRCRRGGGGGGGGSAAAAAACGAARAGGPARRVGLRRARAARGRVSGGRVGGVVTHTGDRRRQFGAHRCRARAARARAAESRRGAHPAHGSRSFEPPGESFVAVSIPVFRHSFIVSRAPRGRDKLSELLVLQQSIYQKRSRRRRQVAFCGEPPEQSAAPSWALKNRLVRASQRATTVASSN
jgi:hypothetical protein